jgi:hypothetical protein
LFWYVITTKNRGGGAQDKGEKGEGRAKKNRRKAGQTKIGEGRANKNR